MSNNCRNNGHRGDENRIQIHMQAVVYRRGAGEGPPQAALLCGRQRGAATDIYRQRRTNFQVHVRCENERIRAPYSTMSHFLEFIDLREVHPELVEI